MRTWRAVEHRAKPSRRRSWAGVGSELRRGPSWAEGGVDCWVAVAWFEFGFEAWFFGTRVLQGAFILWGILRQ